MFWFAALAAFHLFGTISRTNFKTAGLMDRTAVLHGGRAVVQAGGGLVADSDPQAELEECQNKAAAVLRAIAAAATLRPA